MSIPRRNHDGTIQGYQTGGSGLSDGDYGDIVVSGAGTALNIDPTVASAAGRALMDDANAAAQRTTLGLGTAATEASSAFDAAGTAASAVAAHVAAGDPHPVYLTASEGNAAYEVAGAVAAHAAAGDPHPTYMTSAETLAVKLDDFSAPDDNTDLNASTSAHGLMPKGTGSTSTFYRSDMTQAAPTAALAVTTVEVDLGSTAKTSGKFTLVDAGISATSKIMIWQAPGPYTGKGTRADEAEMDKVSCYAEPETGQATVKWSSAFGIAMVPPNGSSGGARVQTSTPYNDAYYRAAVPTVIGRVKGNVKFNYVVS